MSQRKTVALVAVVGAILALALSPLSGIQLGFVPAFLPAFLVAVLSMEMMTAYLLWQQYSAQGELRLLGLSLTYLLTGLLLVPTALSHPYVLTPRMSWAPHRPPCGCGSRGTSRSPWDWPRLSRHGRLEPWST